MTSYGSWSTTGFAIAGDLPMVALLACELHDGPCHRLTAAVAGDCFGLAAMRARAAMLQGAVRITSRLGEGTLVWRKSPPRNGCYTSDVGEGRRPRGQLLSAVVASLTPPQPLHTIPRARFQPVRGSYTVMAGKGRTMRILVPAIGVLAAMLAVVPARAVPPNRGQNRPEDEKAIRQLVDGFVTAYNGHDAAAIAAQFTPDGTITQKTAMSSAAAPPSKKRSPESSRRIRKPASRIRSIRSILSDRPRPSKTALTTVVNDDKTPAEKNRYRAVHVNATASG